MGSPPTFLQQLQRQITMWAQTQDAIRAVLLVGSIARTQHGADEWSDLELEFFVTDPNHFINSDTAWIEQFGTVWTYLDFVADPNAPQRLVLYEGGFKADCTFYKVAQLHTLIDENRLLASQMRGYTILIDKDKLAANLPKPEQSAAAHTIPSEQAYQTVVNVFWYSVVYLAKQIRRRDLWVVKYRDWTLKTHLLRMVEWHSQIQQPQPVDTWYDGHFIFDWVDAMTWQEIQETFGGMSATECWRALMNTVDLFRRLARETAAVHGYSYPEKLDANLTQYIRALQRDDENASQAL